MIARIKIKASDMVAIGAKKALPLAVEGLLERLKTEEVYFTVETIIGKEHLIKEKLYVYTLKLKPHKPEEISEEEKSKDSSGAEWK